MTQVALTLVSAYGIFIAGAVCGFVAAALFAIGRDSEDY